MSKFLFASVYGAESEVFMGEMKKFIRAVHFSDPEYPEHDVTNGVRDVLSRTHCSNLISAVDKCEMVKVGVSYLTGRGNRKEPVKYIFFPELPEEDAEMEVVVRKFVENFYEKMGRKNPYRRVSDVQVRFVERYAVVSL